MGDGLEVVEVVGVGEALGDSLIIVGDVVGEVEAAGLWVVTVSDVEDLPLVAAKATTLIPERPAILINLRLDR